MPIATLNTQSPGSNNENGVEKVEISVIDPVNSWSMLRGASVTLIQSIYTFYQ